MNSLPYGPILVVEDVSNIRDLLEVTLRFKGYPVRTARDGRDALRNIAQERPALIISDILMPHLDGFGLVQRVRINPKTRDIPIIMISATYVSHEDRAFALRLGAIRFLEKPVDTDEFLLTVAEILTQGPPEVPDPLSNADFYTGYVARLENKLVQKENQILRTERLLKSLNEEQKHAFQEILKEEIAFRQGIQEELKEVKRLIRENAGLPTPKEEESF